MAATYRASTTAKTAVAAGTAPFFAIYGSATKIIRIESITISATVATAAVYGDFIVTKRSTAITGGTKTDLTQVPTDSKQSAGSASICGVYTAAPTAGTAVGPIAAASLFCPITGTPALMPPPYVFEFGAPPFVGPSGETGLELPVLRGTTEGLDLSFGTTPTNAPTVSLTVYWTEDTQ
jgi:hypothetical protein